ncbi:MAG: GntR family transcriptional regulator [Saccharofermentanales bacterium]
MEKQNKPLYKKIYDSLMAEIDGGKYKDGDRLPSEKEIADLYGVSSITSKKALELLADIGYIKRIPGRGSFISKETTSIQKAKDDHASIKGMIIGLVLGNFSDSYGSGIISGIENEAALSDCCLALRLSYGTQEKEEIAIDSLIAHGVGGLIVMPVHGENYNPKILQLVLDKFPVVLIDRHLRGLSVPFVGTDNVGAANKATRYLFENGHKSICFMSPPPINTSAIEERIEGFVKCYSEHEIAIDQSLWMTDIMCTIPGRNSTENINADIERIKAHLIAHPQITCVFAVEHSIALMAHRAIEAIGKRVPDDISIICFDMPANFMRDEYYTHIHQREYEMGVTSFKLLNDFITKDDIDIKEFLEADLVIRSSVKSI